MKRLVFLPLLGIITACQPPITREQQLSVYRSRCLDYGYPLGTLEFADCMKEQELHEAALALRSREVEAREQRNRLEQQKTAQGTPANDPLFKWKLW